MWRTRATVTPVTTAPEPPRLVPGEPLWGDPHISPPGPPAVTGSVRYGPTVARSAATATTQKLPVGLLTVIAATGFLLGGITGLVAAWLLSG